MTAAACGKVRRVRPAGNLKTKNLMAKVGEISKLPAARAALLCALIACSQLASGAARAAADSPAPLSSRAAFLRAQRAAQRPQQPSAPAPANQTTHATPHSTTSRPRAVKPLEALAPAAAVPAVAPAAAQATAAAAASAPLAANRSTRTTDIFENGQGFNIFVTTLCERERMAVNIKTSEPFYGIIHTREHRNKAACTVEGSGQTEYNLELSQVLNKQDPAYCGVTRAPRSSAGDKDLLSVIVAVRVHRSIERGDDKFFLLNCTNQCRREDCSAPSARDQSARVVLASPREPAVGETEREFVTPASNNNNSDERRPFLDGLEGDKECNIYKFPWVITLLWCMGILLLALLISQCIMCSSLVCKCVKTEVEEREPSVYEDGSGGRLNLSDLDDDDEDNLYNKKNHPMRIDYDNRDIYKTSNNYEPYSVRDEDCQVKPKTKRRDAAKRAPAETAAPRRR